MAFSLPLPTKKFWLFAGLAVLVVLISLWYVGKGYQDNLEATNLTNLKLSKEEVSYYNKIIARAIELRSITNQTLTLKDKANLDNLTLKPVTSDYKLSDLSIGVSEDAPSLKLYGQALGQILSTFSAVRTNELKVMLDALDSHDQSQLAQLVKIKNDLDNTVLKLLKLKTPKSAGSIQLQLINNLNNQSKLINNMSQVFDQPLLALESAQLEYKTVGEFYQLTGEINKYFRTRGVTFSPNEAVKIYQTI